ncbi:hypothetical protein L1049_013148 [Liquidambar formosana]|uniref:Uncharacterized protein n=1 Tax=Liquidambar formosana TaxID=63359 RepID=A0AAP0RMR2_LIQFO
MVVSHRSKRETSRPRRRPMEMKLYKELFWVALTEDAEDTIKNGSHSIPLSALFASANIICYCEWLFGVGIFGFQYLDIGREVQENSNCFAFALVDTRAVSGIHMAVSGFDGEPSGKTFSKSPITAFVHSFLFVCRNSLCFVPLHCHC